LANFLTKDKRTHYCGDLKQSDVDKEVILMGWTHRRRDHGGVIFVDYVTVKESCKLSLTLMPEVLSMIRPTKSALNLFWQSREQFVEGRLVWETLR